MAASSTSPIRGATPSRRSTSKPSKSCANLPAGFEPNAVVADRGRPFSLRRQPHQQRHLGDRPGARHGDQAAGWRAAARATWRSRPMAPASTARTSIRTPAAFRAPPESEITVIDTARQIVVERDRASPMPPASSTSRLPTDGRLGMAAQLRPKNLIPLAHVEHGWVFGNSISVFGADVGELVQLPIDELDRYFTPPFAIAIWRRTRAPLTFRTTGSDSVTVIDYRQAAGVHPRGRTRTAPDAGQRPLGVGQLRGGADPGGARPPRDWRSRPMASGSTWPTARTTPSRSSTPRRAR